MNSKNILFTDMDGTLLLKDSTISNRMRDALREMTKRGHKLVLTSGRPLPSILERIQTLKLDFPGIYVIANNGGLIYDPENRKNIYAKKLPQDLLSKVIDVVVRSGIHVHAYTDTEIVGMKEDEELIYYMKRIHMPFIKTDDIGAYLKDGSYKVQIIHLTDKDRLEALREELRKHFDSEVEIFFTNNHYLEVFPKGVSKGKAILTLTDHLGFDRANTFAAGDAENDISMIKAAATGIAMANGDEEVKAAADVVTKETNDRDGLIEIIDKYFL